MAEHVRLPAAGSNRWAGVQGQRPLTPREHEVAVLVAHGLTNPQIASRLGLSSGTVRNHVVRVRRKLRLTRRADFAAWALQRGLLAPEPADRITDPATARNSAQAGPDRR